jgi:hypothetical protein
MMTGDQCRAKAREMDDFSERGVTSEWTVQWARMARDWRGLAVMADYQDHMQRGWPPVAPD